MPQRIGVIIPTFHRDTTLQRTLQLLASQTHLPDEVLVVDNAARTSCQALCEEVALELPFPLTYLAAPENGGPAGATASGMEYFLDRFDDTDWIVRGDDDCPRVDERHLERVLHACAEASEIHESVGAVGTSGARFDARRARLTKPGAEPGLVSVDYLATNRYPFFSVAAIRRVGVFRRELFFGHTEVEFGLRLRRGGYIVLRLDGPASRRRPVAPSAWALGEVTWRRFYSVRNQVVLAQEFGDRWATTRVIASVLGKPLVHMVRNPCLAWRHLRMNTVAVRDALNGRLGRTVEPRVVSGTLDARG